MRLSTLLPALALIGCLDSKPGGSADASAEATPETTPDTSAETSAEVGPDEIVDPCFGVSCDDADPCTVDVCIDGACVHEPLTAARPPEPPECVTDADCDDLDTSTVDVCQHRDGACGTDTWAYCEHMRPNPCFDNDVDCGDRDPCTRDRCDTTLGCVHEPIGEGYCDARCSVDAVVDLRTLTSGGPGGHVTTRGVGVAVYEPCIEDGVCLYEMRLGDGDVSIALHDDMPSCWPVTSLWNECTPVLPDVRYIVWGTALASGPTVDGLDLEGYCHDTSGGGVVGHYAATFEVEGQPLVTFVATIEPTEAGFDMTISDVVGGDLDIELDLAAFAAQRPRVSMDAGGEGRVVTSLVLPWARAAAETETIVLFPAGNFLSGSAGPLFHVGSDGAPAQEDTLPYGSLRLARTR